MSVGIRTANDSARLKIQLCRSPPLPVLTLSLVKFEFVRVFIKRVTENARKNDREIKREPARNSRRRNICRADEIKRRKHYPEKSADKRHRDSDQNKKGENFNVIDAERFDRINSDRRIYRRSERTRVTCDGTSRRKIKNSPKHRQS